MTTHARPKDRGGLDLDAVLYWEFPQLDAGELADLSATVHSELETRVGVRLAALCTDDELAEFEGLMDTEDDALCARWLDEHIPHHNQVVRSVADALLAETLTAVEQTQRHDLALNRPQRRRIELADKALLIRALHFQRRRYAMDGDVAVVGLVCKSGISMDVRLWMTDSGLLCARSIFPFSATERHPELLAFVHRWNRDTYLPKVYTVDTSDGSCDLVAELVIPVGPGLHGQLLDHIVAVCVGAMSRVFDAVMDEAPEWQPPL